jgi:hypothetical protein
VRVIASSIEKYGSPLVNQENAARWGGNRIGGARMSRYFRSLSRRDRSQHPLLLSGLERELWTWNSIDPGLWILFWLVEEVSRVIYSWNTSFLLYPPPPSMVDVVRINLPLILLPRHPIPRFCFRCICDLPSVSGSEWKA